jgi:hypothetical protein
MSNENATQQQPLSPDEEVGSSGKNVNAAQVDVRVSFQ